MIEQWQQHFHLWIKQFNHFCHHLWHRIGDDQVKTLSGHLAFVSLLSLVPLIAVMVSVLSAFPVFADLRETIEGFIFQNFLPTTGANIQSHLGQFVSNASKGGAVGIIALVVVALLLIATIDKVLNDIWRVDKTRPQITSFAIYWMVLTLGPILVGTSIALSSYLLGMAMSQNSQLGSGISLLLKYLPFFLSWLSFILLYMAVPNCKVKFKHALTGGLFAAIMFELSKKIFAIYVSLFPTYEAIYGALAAIPILFLWVYLSWGVLLIGAEITASLTEWRKSFATHEN
ncbi:virulence factor BrkB family protein [Paraferrimonas sp. SM1919]|uniref:virulence factor BrkB family protein n=1 Tax=Paraferrimonas sp. SM1919 TaxID=2662263 RepID=UPI0013D2E78C|nr:virulence factor BrkB family protein [Paraferrimonas sp. SM1919]